MFSDKKELIYEKIGRRYFVFDFFGFPSDGVFLISDKSNSMVSDKNWTLKYGEEKAFLAALFFHYIDNLDDNIKYNFENLISHFLSINTLNLTNPRFIELSNKSSKKDLFIKKGRSYKKIGENFIGFPNTGIFNVIDGKNNKINLLNFNYSFVKIKFSEDEILTYIEKNKSNKNISIYEFQLLFSQFLSLNIIII